MRLPLAVNLESRDGLVDRDAKVLNGIIETRGEGNLWARMRPGNVDLGLVKAGIAQLLYSWNGIKAILADYLNAFTLSTVTTPTQTSLTPTAASQHFSAQDNGSSSTTPYMMVQNGLQAWSVNQAGTVAAITLPAGLGTHVISITSLTRSGTVATALTAVDPELEIGQSITIAGATPVAYNGAQTVTSVTLSSFQPGAVIPITITRVGTTATARTVSGLHPPLISGNYALSGANESAYNGTFAITVTEPNAFTYTVTVTADTTRTWNPADKSAGIALSGGNLVATLTTLTGGANSARATASKSAGKYYWEVTVGSAASATISIGVADAAAALNNYIGADAQGWGYLSDGRSYHGGAAPPYGSVYSTGDVVGVALDLDSASLAFYKNGVYQGLAFVSGIAGSLFPAISIADHSAASVTVNFGATAFAYSVPTGFRAFQINSPSSPATGAPVITLPVVTNPAKFTFTIGGSPVTPATGTITGTYTKTLVPGITYIDGYFCLMDETGVIYNSAIDDPTTYPALAFITAQNENGGGKAINKSGAYVIAFKEWSTEFFYNTQSGTTGSPLAPVDNGFTKIGCASGMSVATLDGSLFWISQTREGGRGVYMMTGLQQQKISTPDVDRILKRDTLATVHAYGMKIDGHSLYLITLVASNITIVYDLDSQTWAQWSSYTITSLPSITSITRVGDTATVTTAVAHGLSDGDPILISGANEGYNGIYQISYVSATMFTYQVFFQPATPATGTLIFGKLTETYFKFTKHLNYNGQDLFLHESDGHLYFMDSAQMTDSGIPINFFTRTTRLDGGTTGKKKMRAARVIGDRMAALMMVRWSDNDCSTFKPYRIVDMDNDRSELRKCGAFRRRTIETRYISGRYLAVTAPHLNALELEIE